MFMASKPQRSRMRVLILACINGHTSARRVVCAVSQHPSFSGSSVDALFQARAARAAAQRDALPLTAVVADSAAQVRRFTAVPVVAETPCSDYVNGVRRSHAARTIGICAQPLRATILASDSCPTNPSASCIAMPPSVCKHSVCGTRASSTERSCLRPPLAWCFPATEHIACCFVLC